MAVKLTVELTFYTEGGEDAQMGDAHATLDEMVRGHGIDVEVTAEEFIGDGA